MTARMLHLSDFPGGLKLDEHKDLVAGAPIALAPVPPELIIPLAQHVGASAEPVVQVGQYVRRGEVIGRAQGYVSLPIHASSSGTVTAIEDRPVAHPSRLPARCVVIATDGSDTPAPPDWDVLTDPEQAEPHVLRDIARAAGIAGQGGASFPTFVKLNPAQPVDALVINGAECEPYIACDQALMREQADEIIAGARIMMRALDTAVCLIGIEDNKPEAIRAMTEAAAHDARIQVVTVPTRYPQGGEKQLIQTLTGREVPSHGLPLDIGIVCQNPGTARALYRAAVFGEALTDRVISLTGHAMAAPRNVRARIGTPMRFLVEHFGGFSEAPGRLLMGGPMMGIELPDLDIPVVKASNCLLALPSAELPPQEDAMPCIRCGACVDACPAKLLPQQLYWHAKAREFDKAQAYNLFDCIECGCCAAVCPSHIPLVQYYRFAKTEIWAEERERQAADAARIRHEERQQRLEREAAEKEAARKARKQKAAASNTATPSAAAPAEQSASTATDDPVARAMAAARARKASSTSTTDAATPGQSASSGEAAADDPVARAMAAAKARKTARNDAAASHAEQHSASDAVEAAPPADDPVARAQAAARARKAEPAAAAEATSEANQSEAPAPATDSDDPIERAKAAARARKAAKAEASATRETEAEETGAANGVAAARTEDDPVERAKAAARARKAKKAAAAGDAETKHTGTATGSNAASAEDDPIERAKAAARARKAEKAATAEVTSDVGNLEAPPPSPDSDDPIERAKAAARARKAAKAQDAARQKQAGDGTS